MSFIGAARRYWLGVFPRVCLERRRRRARAARIPDPLLRRTALDAQRKWGNVEGAAAFAAFVPRRHRAAAARAMTCFQAAYNYLDMLGEQPCADPAANGRCLHSALLVALDPGARHLDYYEYCPRREDGAYLTEILDACRAALATLPAYPALAPAALRAAGRIVEFQSCNTGRLQGDLAALERWARGVTPPGEDLRWWETAAAGGSSLGVYALIALAAEPDSWMPDRKPATADPTTGAHAAVATGDSARARADGSASTPAAAVAIADPTGVAAENTAATLEALAAVQQDAYFPWIGALHSLLDNLVDVAEDRATGQHNLIGLYASPQEAAARMGMLAERSLLAAREQQDARAHTLVLAAMASFYLSTPEAATPAALPLARAVRGALDGPADLAMLVFRARSRVRGLLPGASGRRARGAEIVMPGVQARPAPMTRSALVPRQAPVPRPALVGRPAPMPRPEPMTPRATAARPTPTPVAVGEPRGIGETRAIK